MTVGNQTQQRAEGPRKYWFYRCTGGATPAGCRSKTTIAAELLENLVVSRLREVLADESATATGGAELGAAKEAATRAHGELERAIEILSVVGDVASAQARLVELKTAAGAADEKVAELSRRAGASLTLNAAADWSSLTVDEQRALIVAVIRSVRVTAGRLADRVAVELVE